MSRRNVRKLDKYKETVVQLKSKLDTVSETARTEAELAQWREELEDLDLSLQNKLKAVEAREESTDVKKLHKRLHTKSQEIEELKVQIRGWRHHTRELLTRLSQNAATFNYLKKTRENTEIGTLTFQALMASRAALDTVENPSEHIAKAKQYVDAVIAKILAETTTDSPVPEPTLPADSPLPEDAHTGI